MRQHGRHRALVVVDRHRARTALATRRLGALGRGAQVQRETAELGRVVEHAVGHAAVLGRAVVAGAVGRRQVVGHVPGRRGDAVEVGPGIELPLLAPHGAERTAQAQMAPAALQAHGGLVMPEGLPRIVLGQARVQIEARAQPEGGLQAAAQVLDAGNGQVAALNRPQLAGLVEIPEHARVQIATDGDVGAGGSRLGGHGQGGGDGEGGKGQAGSTTHPERVPGNEKWHNTGAALGHAQTATGIATTEVAGTVRSGRVASGDLEAARMQNTA